METQQYQITAGRAASPPQGIQWEEVLRKTLRTLQVNVPFLQDVRFALQRQIREITNSPIESDFDALKLLPGMNNGLAIDVGANRGATIQAIRMRTENTRVMAFEPNPLIFSRLNRLYKGNKNVKLFNFGLSDHDEILPLNVPFYKDFMFDGLASFDVGAALTWLRDRIFFYDERHLRLRRIECCLTRLDRFEVNPTFIKIDVQGFEHQVLQGSVETLDRCRPVVLIETPSADVVRLLKAMRYRPYRYSSGGLSAGYGELNTFFIPGERALRE